MPYPSDVRVFNGLSLTAALNVVSGRPGGWAIAAFTDGKILLKCRGEYDRTSPPLFFVALYTGEIIVETDQGIVSGPSWRGSSWTCTPDGPLQKRPEGALYFHPRLVVPAAMAVLPDSASGDERSRGYDQHADVARGVELARAGLNYSRAAAALFEERHPKPVERELLNSWLDEQRRFVGRTRDKISKADKATPSS